MNSKDRFVLTILSGAEDGKEIKPLNTPITIGRDTDNQICLPYDNRVSRHHAKIIFENDEYWIEDMESTNGTYLNDVKLVEKTLVSSGEIFLVGTIWMKFFVNKNK